MILAFMFTVALIGLIVLWFATLSLAISSCLVRLLFLGKPKGSLRCPAYLLKQSITMLNATSEPFGSETHYALSRFWFPWLSYTMITKSPCILRRVRSFMNEPNTLKLIVISSRNGCYLGRLLLDTFPLLNNLLISSLRHWVTSSFNTYLASLAFPIPTL